MYFKIFNKFWILFCILFVIQIQYQVVYAAVEYFTNPIFPRNSADPAILRVENYYYLTLSENSFSNLTVFKSLNLTNFYNAESKVVFTTPEGYSDLWAPEMHKINGQLLIYFTFQGGGESHRMYVIEAEDPNNPMGNWKSPIKLDTFPVEGGIDGTVLQHGDGNLYFAFSSMACVWLARMTNTTYVNASEIVLLRRPEAEWECLGNNGGRLCMSEGPFFIYNNGVSYMTFSASETMSPHYCLGLMSIDGDKDPMVLSNWWQGPDGPVFWRNDDEDVYCTGHAAFTVSPDGKETWMVYHGTDSATEIVGHRVARIEKIEWGLDGKPVFPRPHGINHPVQVPSGQSDIQHFTNPIFPRNSADPNILRLGNNYYLSISENSEHNLTIFKSPVMTNFYNVESKVAFATPQGYSDLWAPEMHLINGKLLIYFTMQGGGESHKMYVIEAEDPNNPMGNWKSPIKLMPNFGLSAIDGTVLQHGNGQMYFVFSSIDCLCLWIARMVNTTYVDTTEYVLLRKPKQKWECLGLNGRELCLNEGPFFLYNGNISYMIFSVSETFGPDYSLGMMSIDSTKDPMVPENWWQGPDGPVFWRNDAENVYTAGHAAFTVSPDGSETWMVYHASDSPTFINGNRIARIEKIDWGNDGKPVFPRPHGFGTYIPVPSGQLALTN